MTAKKTVKAPKKVAGGEQQYKETLEEYIRRSPGKKTTYRRKGPK